MLNFLHRLFGWDYILFDFCGSEKRRVREFPNGIKYVKCYGEIFIIREDGYLIEIDGRKIPYIKLTGAKNAKTNI